MEPGHGNDMPDTADRQGRFGAVIQLIAVSQQQGLGEGKHILRQAPPENILHSLCQPLGKEPQALRLSRLHRRGRPGRGPEENTGGGGIAGFLLPAGQGQPEPELPCQPVSGLHRSVLFQVCHQGIALPVQVDPALHLLTVVRLLPIVQSQNFRRTGLSGQVVSMQLNALEKAPPRLGEFDCIVSNPPYIPDGDIAGLDPSVRDYEPHLALKGGADGLDFYRAICENWRGALRTGGRLYFEVGIGQADDVLRIMRAVGFGDIEVIPDLNGIPRVVWGILHTEI